MTGVSFSACKEKKERGMGAHRGGREERGGGGEKSLEAGKKGFGQGTSGSIGKQTKKGGENVEDGHNGKGMRGGISTEKKKKDY